MNMKVFILVDVILTRKFENKETKSVSYMTTINSSRLAKTDDGVEVLIPETKILWLDEALPRGQHLLMVEVLPSKKNGISYKFIKRVKEEDLVQALAEVE